MASSKHKSRCCNCCLGYMIIGCPLTAVSLIGAAVALLLLFPIVLRQQVEERVPIQEGSVTLAQLLSPSVPVFKDIYFFNLTNPTEFENGAKPQLNEVGPYSYRETRQKMLLNISSDGSLLTYNQTRLFHFSQETTGEGLSESDTICTINVPLVAAAAQLEGQDDFLLNVFGPAILSGIFDNTDARLFVCQPATPLAFEYTDDLIQELNSNLALRIAGQNIPTPSVSINANNSANNSLPSIIHTGVGDLESIGQYVQWQGNDGTLGDVWPNGMGANDINGTEGLVFGPFLEPGQDLEIFVDDTMRTLPLVYTETIDKMGIESFRYRIANSTFESAFTNPENARWGSWCPDGLFFIGVVQEPTVPVFASKPHFLDGDPALLEAVEGLSPDRKAHDSFIDVEPLTGANVGLNVQLQINAQVNQSDNFEQLENINGTLYMPILYISQNTVLTQGFVDLLLENGLRAAYVLPTVVRVLAALMILGAAVGLFLSILACGICARRRCKKSSSSKPNRPVTFVTAGDPSTPVTQQPALVNLPLSSTREQPPQHMEGEREAVAGAESFDDGSFEMSERDHFDANTYSVPVKH